MNTLKLKTPKDKGTQKIDSGPHTGPGESHTRKHDRHHHCSDAGTGGQKQSSKRTETKLHGTQRRHDTGQPTSHHTTQTQQPTTGRRKEARRRKRLREGREGRGEESPAGGGEQTARKTGGTSSRFPVKGAADALSNPEADIPGGVGGVATGRAGLG